MVFPGSYSLDTRARILLWPLGLTVSIPGLERALQQYTLEPSEKPFDLKSVPLATAPMAEQRTGEATCVLQRPLGLGLLWRVCLARKATTAAQGGRGHAGWRELARLPLALGEEATCTQTVACCLPCSELHTEGWKLHFLSNSAVGDLPWPSLSCRSPCVLVLQRAPQLPPPSSPRRWPPPGRRSSRVSEGACGARGPWLGWRLFPQEPRSGLRCVLALRVFRQHA